MVKLNVKLEISHEFLSQNQILIFLAQHRQRFSVRRPKRRARHFERATDLALAVKRPVAVSASQMFRHFPHQPEICVKQFAA